MTSTHPRDDGAPYSSSDRSVETSPSNLDRDQRSGYANEQIDDRMAGTDYRDDGMTHGEPLRYGPATYDVPTRKVRETKPAFLTTEFWFAAGGIAALIVIYLVEDDPSLDLFRTALLATLIGVAYIVSRGLAKAGSRTTRQPADPGLTVR